MVEDMVERTRRWGLGEHREAIAVAVTTVTEVVYR
jgi:hypothetical protein